MATVVYVPRDERFGELGMGIQQGIVNFMKKKQEDDESNRIANILKAVDSAPDRSTALNAVAASAGSLKDPNQLALAFRMVDERHPQDDNSLLEGEVFSNVTGDATPFWFKKTDVGKIKDPSYVGQLTGLDPQSFSMTKPAKILEYVDPMTGNSIGTFVPGMHPEGAITAADFQRDRQEKADKRAEGAAERSEQSLHMTRKQLEISERRAEETARHNRAVEGRTIGKDNEDKEVKRVSTEQNRLKNYLVTQYGGKTLADGSLDLSSLDEPKRQKFTEEFDRGSEMIETGKAKTWGQAVRMIHKEQKSAQPPGGPQAKKSSKEYQEYLDAYNRAKGNKELQKKITDRARKLGVVK